VQCGIGGSYKQAVREYKNILIFPIDCFRTRKKQGNALVSVRINPV